MALDAEIREALEQALKPKRLEVVNESAQHAGHMGDDGSGESHWRVVIDAASAPGKTRIARHRAVHAALGPGIIDRIHALAIEMV